MPLSVLKVIYTLSLKHSGAKQNIDSQYRQAYWIPLSFRNAAICDVLLLNEVFENNHKNANDFDKPVARDVRGIGQ